MVHSVWLTILLLAVLTVQPVRGQKVYELNRRVDSVLTERYRLDGVDTAYIIRPQSKWTLTGQLTVSGARIGIEGRKDGQSFETKLQADYKSTVSIGISYLGLSLNLSLNPAKMMGRYSDYELSFRSYGRRFGYDIAYQDAHNFKGWHEQGDVHQDITTSEDMFQLRTLNANAYYVFNARRFSYPAAFAHSYIQRRSAGSFLLAASAQGQHGRVSGDYPTDFKMTHIALGAGYGYNYVPRSGWLLHISGLPTFIVYSHTSLTTGDTRIPLHYHFPEAIMTTRSTVVRQAGNKFFGLSMVFNYTFVGQKESLAVHNSKWFAKAFCGIRL